MVVPGAQETPEGKLLNTIFGLHADEQELKPDKLVTPLLVAVAGRAFSGIVNGPLAALAEKWITHHLPAAQIEEIATLASAVIGDRNKATQWLTEPNVAMDNRAPIDLIGEKDGYERVKSLLLRIEYGALA